MDTMNTGFSNERLIRMPEVLSMVGLSKAQIYLLITKGEFPKQVKLTSGGKVSGWLLSEILAWIDSRIQSSREGSAD